MTSLQFGIVQSLTQDVVYALPPRRALLYADGTPTIVVSNDSSFSASKTLTLDTNNQAEVAAAFIKCTSGNITLMLKPGQGV